MKILILIKTIPLNLMKNTEVLVGKDLEKINYLNGKINKLKSLLKEII